MQQVMEEKQDKMQQDLKEQLERQGEQQERMQQELKEHHESMLQEKLQEQSESLCLRWTAGTTALEERQTGLEKKQVEMEQHMEGLHSKLNASEATVSDISDIMKVLEKCLMENRQSVIAKEDTSGVRSECSKRVIHR